MTNPRTNQFRGLIPVHVLIYATITTYVKYMAYSKTIRDLVSQSFNRFRSPDKSA